MIKLPVLASATVVAAMLLAAPVHADSDMDAKFISGLDIGNIPYKNSQNAIVLAHVVCSNFSGGSTYFQTVGNVTEMNPAWTDFQDGYFVGMSVGAYCPDQRGKIPTSR